MKKAAQLSQVCQVLSRAPLTAVWYRAIHPQFGQTALASAHTAVTPSRFNQGAGGNPEFEILYLTENPMVALFEVRALFGLPTTPGGVIANPKSWTILNINVQLQQIVDLTQVSNQDQLGTSAQELTGDWLGYTQRNPNTSVGQPVGAAPTQELGAALFATPQVEGFLTLSAKLPYHKNLVVFPSKLQTGSSLQF